MNAPSASLTSIVTGLAPAFIAGFAVQQAVEVISSLLAFSKGLDNNIKAKKAVLSLIAVVISAIVVTSSKFDVFAPFSGDTGHSGAHVFLTIVFVSAGTEGFNSLLKWLSYKKEDVKATAADKKHALANGAGSALQKMPS